MVAYSKNAKYPKGKSNLATRPNGARQVKTNTTPAARIACSICMANMLEKTRVSSQITLYHKKGTPSNCMLRHMSAKDGLAVASCHQRTSSRHGT